MKAHCRIPSLADRSPIGNSWASPCRQRPCVPVLSSPGRIPAHPARDVALRPALAKLTRPKLYDALPRARLFALLDEAAKRPIVWVSGAPGAGKTTLVASWIESQRRRHFWY